MGRGRMYVIQNDFRLLVTVRSDNFEIASIKIRIIAQQFQIGKDVADVVVGYLLRRLGGWYVHLCALGVPRVLRSFQESGNSIYD